MLTFSRATVHDDYRMAKQAISVTLSPDNLVWLKGRARVEAVGSLSECLDRLLTRARFGGHTARPVRSMKGSLASLAVEEADGLAAVSAEAWRGWQARWNALLVGVEASDGGPATGHPGRVAATVSAVPAAVKARRRGGRG